MSSVLRQVSACSPSQRTGSYIYEITSTTGGGLACITSADELFVLDRQNLSNSLFSFGDVPTGVTCMTPVDAARSGVLCAGRNGIVAAFDIRSATRVAQLELDRSVTALASNGIDVAVGTELAHQQAIISVWDRRQNKTRWQSTENNDDITDLCFHPTRSNHLLGGGVDGLVSIFDTNIEEEDESLLQVVNHGPIHKAGFLSDSKIYALSHDEKFSIHSITTESEGEADDSPPPVIFDDLRPRIPCEYVIDIIPFGNTFVVAAGSHSSNSRVDLVPIQDEVQLKHSCMATLSGAHGEEIVRSIFADLESNTVFTAGEDGQVRAFRQADSSEKKVNEARSPKVKRSPCVRFNPY